MITYEEKELLKDDILKYLITTDGIYSHQIAKNLNKDIELIEYLIYQLKLDEFIITHAENEKVILIHSRGRFFLNIDGGYSYLVDSRRRKAKYNILSKFAIVANAIVIIFIALMSIYVQWDSSKKQDEIDKLKNELSILKSNNITKK